MFFIVKVFFSALIIAIVTVIAKKFPSYGGIIAALPLVSLLSLIWLSIQGENSNSLSKFALGVLWGFPATVVEKRLFPLDFSRLRNHRMGGFNNTARKNTETVY